MHCNVSIRATNSSYEIYPIEEKDESEEEFIPYDRQMYQLKCQLIDSLHKGRTKSEQSQSYDNKRMIVRLRAKSISHSDKKELIPTNSLHVGSQKHPLPPVIHSSKQFYPVRLQKESPSKKKLARLQANMKQHRPAFFKDNESMQDNNIRIAKRLNLQILSRSSVFLFDIPKKPKEELQGLPISRKQLRKLMQVQRMESTMVGSGLMKSTLSHKSPPKLTRSKLFDQI